MSWYFLKMPKWFNCFFGIEAHLDLSYSVLQGNLGISKNKVTSIQNFFPIFGVEKIYLDVLTFDCHKCCQQSTDDCWVFVTLTVYSLYIAQWAWQCITVTQVCLQVVVLLLIYFHIFADADQCSVLASLVYSVCLAALSFILYSWLYVLIFGRPYYRSSLWYSMSSVCLSSVCPSVTFCIVAKRCVLTKKCLKEWIGNQGQKVHFFGRRHISTSGFAATATETTVFALFLPVGPTAQQSVLDGRNWLSSSKPCACCRIVWSELKPDSGLFVFIT